MKKLSVCISLVTIIFVTVTFSYGEQYWAKTYGERGDSEITAIIQTLDGSFIVTGYIWPEDKFSYNDILIFKTDLQGNIIWEKKYFVAPYSDDEVVVSIIPTSDGGYVMTGHTYTEQHYDCLVVKIDNNGNLIWDKSYGVGVHDDFGHAILQTPDGGYIVAGRTEWEWGDDPEALLFKMDAIGNISWLKTYGGTGFHAFDSIKKTTDGGYIVLGKTASFGVGGMDVWVLKIDSNFDIIWQKTYGGSDNEGGYFIQQTSDGGYIVASLTLSFGAGNGEVWILKLDSNGNVLWQKAYGTSHSEWNTLLVQQTYDGGYIVAVDTYSGIPGSDILVLKLDSTGTISWQKTYGKLGGDYVSTIQQTSDGYIITGSTNSLGGSNTEMLILKVDSNGDIPGCDIIGTSNVIVTDTMVTALPSNCIIQDASYSLTGDNTFTFQTTTIETSSECCYDTDDNDFDCIAINEDNCPNDYNPDQENSDSDSYGNACDNCPNHYNPDQVDADGDGIGDVCDISEAAIPTLSEWGMIAFMTIIMGIGVMILRKRKMA